MSNVHRFHRQRDYSMNRMVAATGNPLLARVVVEDGVAFVSCKHLWNQNEAYKLLFLVA